MTLLREPFVHFALLGVAIFVWFALVNPEAVTGTNPDEIVVDQRVVETLGAQFRAKMNRPPTPEEAEAIVDRYIRDEIMVREARSLALDEGDGIVRNRLVQKMAFLTTAAAQSAVPDDATLQQHLEENADRFRTGVLVSFKQYPLDEGLDAAAVTELLAKLQTGEGLTVNTRLQLLPTVVQDADERQIDGTFGRGFFASIADLPRGEWAGPIRSGFGLHFVRIGELVPAVLPPLEDVREDVLFDWRRVLSDQLTEAQMVALMQDYSVTQLSAEEIRAWIDP